MSAKPGEDQDVASGNLFSPERRRQAVVGIRARYGLSERHACRIVGQHHGTQRYMPSVQADEDGLTRAIVASASEYGRYGYRRVTALLKAAGWQVGKDRVQRIWCREGLKVPSKQTPVSTGTPAPIRKGIKQLDICEGKSAAKLKPTALP